MIKLQEDIIGIYNSLIVFNKDTIISNFPLPIKVRFEKEYSMLVFEQNTKSVRLRTPVFYCEDLVNLVKPTYLLPEDYDYLMANLQSAITSGNLIKDRVILSPERYGFDIYITDEKELWKGPKLISSARFVSGNNFLFKWLTRKKYKLND